MVWYFWDILAVNHVWEAPIGDFLYLISGFVSLQGSSELIIDKGFVKGAMLSLPFFLT